MEGPLILAGGGLGVLVGSFIGAAAARLPRNESVVTGRSHCDSCQRPLGVVDLVPVASFLLARGRCRSCGAQIDRQHLLAEVGGAIVGALAVLSGRTLGEAVAFAVFGWQMLLLVLLDARHFWLPLRLVAVLGASAIVLPLTSGVDAADWPAFALDRIAGGAVGFALLAAPALLYRRLREREGMGEADPWLLAAIGLWLGVKGVVFVLLLAAMAGLAAALVLRLAGRRVDGDSALPLGTLMGLSAMALTLGQGLVRGLAWGLA